MAFQIKEQCFATIQDTASSWLAYNQLVVVKNVRYPGTSITAANASCATQLGAIGSDQFEVIERCTNPNNGEVFTASWVQVKPAACTLIEGPDALAMSWYVVAAWAAVYAVKLLGRIVRDR